MIGIILIFVIQSILLIKSYFGYILNQKTLNLASMQHSKSRFLNKINDLKFPDF